MSIFATSAYVHMKAARKGLCMTVKSIRKGLNRETRALLEYIRRARPADGRVWLGQHQWRCYAVSAGVKPNVAAACRPAVRMGVGTGQRH